MESYKVASLNIQRYMKYKQNKTGKIIKVYTLKITHIHIDIQCWHDYIKVLTIINKHIYEYIEQYTKRIKACRDANAYIQIYVFLYTNEKSMYRLNKHTWRYV